MAKMNWLYRVIKWFVKLFYPRIQVRGQEHLPEGPAMIVGNHSQMNGPIACELYTPGKHYTWCASQMMKLKEVPQYAFEDFWANKPKSVRWLYKILSYVIAPFSVCIFNNADTIPVYHDARVIQTFKVTTQKLCDGAKVVVFPEGKQKHNHIIHSFQDKFIDIAKLYYKRTGLKLAFVPMYLAPELKLMVYGQPVYFDPEQPVQEQREKICHYLMEEVTALAQKLPRHKIIPYENIPRKNYPYNIPENELEKTCV